MSTEATGPEAGPGRIVVGVDGSPHSAEALRWALDQSRLTGQPVEAVISWQVPVSWAEAAAALSVLDWEGEARGTLEATIADVAGPEGADRISQRVVMGHPAGVLLEAEAALLVIGSRGRGGFTGMLLGSVSQHVISRARCPVVVVRADA